MSATCCSEVSPVATKAPRSTIGIRSPSGPSMAMMAVRRAVCRRLVPSVKSCRQLTALAMR
eukprot:511904-Prymnesium_polylepis.1